MNDSWQFAAREDPAKPVVLGISNEDDLTVLNWLQENHRPFRTLLDAAEMTFTNSEWSRTARGWLRR